MIEMHILFQKFSNPTFLKVNNFRKPEKKKKPELFKGASSKLCRKVILIIRTATT